MGPKKHSNPKAAPSKSTPPTPSNPSPNWPPFKPLLPTSDLSLTSLVDSQIVLIKNFWTGKLCKDYVAFLRTLPLVTTPGKPKKGEALRVNDRFQITDEAFANRLWLETGLKDLVCGIENEDGSTNDDGEEIMSIDDRRELWYFSRLPSGETALTHSGEEML